MSKFKAGDKVTWHGDRNYGDWRWIRENKVVGVVTSVRASGLGYTVRFPGFPEKGCLEKNLALVEEFKTGDHVTGKHKYTNQTVTGVVKDPAYFEGEDGERSVRVALDPGFCSLADPGSLVHLEPETVTLMEDKTMTTPALIGPKPEAPKAPKFQFPFHTNGNEVSDQGGKVLVEVEANGTSYSEDEVLARVIADALNAKFAPAVTKVKTEFDPSQGRILVDSTSTIDGRTLEIGNAFAFEVAENKFWFSTSLEKALQDSDHGRQGWTPSYYHVDIRTGLPVIAF